MNPEVYAFIGQIITSLIAIASLVVSLSMKFHELKASSITIQRIDWIKTVRDLCAEFIIEFSKDAPKKSKLDELAIRIKLYGRRKNDRITNDYYNLYEGIDKCLKKWNTTNTQEKEKYKDLMIGVSQDMLQSAWDHMKRESGISEKRDALSGKATNKKYRRTKYKRRNRY